MTEIHSMETSTGAKFKFERIDKDNVMSLVIEHQVGLFQLVCDFQPDEYRNNILAHAALGKVFDLPTVLTTRPNGPLPKEIVEMHPNRPFKRNWEINAWDNKDVRAAVRATGKNRVIMAGIITDVYIAFLALSLIEEGYTVYASASASGCQSQRIADDANDRMRAAGVNVLSVFSVVCDLMRDWRNTLGSAELLPYFDKYMANYGYLVRGHALLLIAERSSLESLSEDVEDRIRRLTVR